MSRPPFVPYRERPLVFVDLETSGLDPSQHEILELAAVSATFDRQTGKLCPLASVECKVRPTRIQFASPEALRVNGYDEAVWEREAVSIGEALIALFGVTAGLASPMLIGHNLPKFDLPFLVAALARLPIAPPAFDYPALDTAAMAWPLIVAGVVDRISLVSLCGHFGIPTDGAHRAMRDVELTMSLYEALIGRNANI